MEKINNKSTVDFYENIMNLKSKHNFWRLESIFIGLILSFALVFVFYLDSWNNWILYSFLIFICIAISAKLFFYHKEKATYWEDISKSSEVQSQLISFIETDEKDRFETIQNLLKEENNERLIKFELNFQTLKNENEEFVKKIDKKVKIWNSEVDKMIESLIKEREKSTFKNINEIDIFKILGDKSLKAENQIIHNQIYGEVLELIEELPETQREVFTLRINKGLSFREISEQTHVSLNTVLSRMRYALSKLSKIMDEKNLKKKI